MTASPEEKAFATSRSTWSESFACSEKTRMSTRQASRPCMIPLVQVAPGSISRGAIQQLIPADSRWAQIASAVSRSLLEWLMKTIDGILPLLYQDLTRFGHRWLGQNPS